MSCSKNKINNGCGCGEKYLTTTCSCQENTCDEESCSEVFDSKCILYLENDFSSGNFSVKKGESVNDILQKLAVYVNDTTIDSSVIPCGINISKIKRGSAKITWNELDEKDIVVMFMAENDDNWTEISVNENIYILQNLLENTNYYIKIKNTTDSVESVVINFKTLQ